MTIQPDTDDIQVRVHILEELQWVPNLAGGGIDVDVTAGLVVLSGSVATYPEKFLAEQAARRVYGVGALRDEITVVRTRESVTDPDLTRHVEAALQRSVDVPAGRVTAVVHNGVVTLRGELAWEFQRVAARRAVAYLNGVERINVEIVIRPDAPSVGVMNSIEAALVRDADLREQEIVVTATRGDVRLRGAVRTWSQSRRASDLAWSAPGVTSVTNGLTVGGPSRLAPAAEHRRPGRPHA